MKLLIPCSDNYVVCYSKFQSEAPHLWKVTSTVKEVQHTFYAILPQAYNYTRQLPGNYLTHDLLHVATAQLVLYASHVLGSHWRWLKWLVIYLPLFTSYHQNLAVVRALSTNLTHYAQFCGMQGCMYSYFASCLLTLTHMIISLHFRIIPTPYQVTLRSYTSDSSSPAL